MSGQLVFFDIPTKDGTSWSFNPWKIRLVLNMKGIDYKTEWLEYPDIEGRLKPTGLEGDPTQIKPYTCPTVLFPDGTWIMNSAKIVKRLEADYPEPPLNVDSELTQVAYDLVSKLADRLSPVLIPLVPRRLLGERSAEYFRETRKEFLGMTLDELEAKHGGEQAWERAYEALDEATEQLNKTEGPFFHGEKVSWADCIYISFLYFIKKFDEEFFKRVVERSPPLGKMWEASAPWLERKDY
ncbi:glutathione s-transferase [Colletotrichum musicola]|uniref:Glutathione s-transferase n=1 Tax=Colletotrichum musicola TaxID=2175873 RepID=A0A8H6JKH2_9PEZI|nr:glutathione s-transferase [Colletotrichum musicola]